MRKYRKLKSMLLITAISTASFTATMTAAQSQSAGKPPYGDAIIAGTKNLIDAGEIPNAVTFISEEGEIVFRDVQGWRDIEAGIAMTEDTIFRHFSTSKPMTCAAILTLVDDGLVDIDAPVKSYLPEFGDMQVRTQDGLVPAERDITIRHLMTHTSGIVYAEMPSPVSADYAEAGVSAIPNRMDETLAEHNKRLAKLPLAAQPGTEWNYGESMGVLGGVVEAVSGQSLGSYLQERVFTPLQMTDTAFYAPGGKASRLSQLYARIAPGTLQMVGYARNFGGDPGQEPLLEYGGAGLVGTAGDAMNFLHMLLNNGMFEGKQILSEKSVRLMTSDQLEPALGNSPVQVGPPDARWTNIGFGFCGQVVKVGADGFKGAPGEYSWAGWAGTEMWIDPAAKRAGIVATQALPTAGLDYPLSDVVRGAIHSE
ncbi:MAG: serine hydrolase domain-containing protein [Pseudomonadota bacterium]